MARGNEIFFLPKQRTGMWEVGSGVLGKARPNTKRPHQNPPKGQAKHETPSPTPTKRPGQTRNAPTKTHQKVSPSQGSKPHHHMKCERGTRQSRVPLSHFGGRGGTRPPTQKKRNTQLVTRDRMYSRVMAAMAPVEISLGHTAVHSPSLEQPPKCSF